MQNKTNKPPAIEVISDAAKNEYNVSDMDEWVCEWQMFDSPVAPEQGSSIFGEGNIALDAAPNTFLCTLNMNRIGLTQGSKAK